VGGSLSTAISADITTGGAPLDVTLQAVSVGASETAFYNWDFGDGQMGTGAQVRHIFTQAADYLVTVRLTDGERTATATQQLHVRSSDPLKAVAGDDQVAATGSTVGFDGGASTTAERIDSWSWDFGDGTTSADKVATHVYTSPGTYTVTLRVTAGDQSAVDSATVTATSPTADELAIDVTDGSSELSGATVLIIDANGTRFQGVSDQSGRAHLIGVPDGSYTANVWLPDYLPGTVPVTVADGKGAAVISLRPGRTVVVGVTSAPMSLEQIIAAGIDPEDPANQNAVDFTVNLAVNQTTISFGGITAAGGFPSCPSVSGVTVTCGGGSASFTSGGYQVSVSSQYVANQPQLVWLVVPVGASWLKEFFSVQMVVTNLAHPGFTVDGGLMSLSLPDGLSLAPTATVQSATFPVDPIPGQSSASHTWIVRGDSAGNFAVRAGFRGTLQPFGAPVVINATSATTIHVWGGDAVHITVDADNDMWDGYPYRVRVGLTNKADVPIYNTSVQLSATGKQHYIYQPRQGLEQGTDIILPGETFWTDDYIFVPDFTGSINPEQSFIAMASGAGTVDIELSQHDPSTDADSAPALRAFPMKDSVGLKWDSVPGATGYEIYRIPDRQTDFSATPIATVSAGNELASVIPQPGGSTAWYAVSSIVNGIHIMNHPLIETTASTYDTAPTTSGQLSSTVSCFEKGENITATVQFNDPFFELAGWSASLDGGPIAGGTIAGRSAKTAFTLDSTLFSNAGSRTLTVSASDSSGAHGPGWQIEIMAGCDPLNMIVVGDSIAWGQGLKDNEKYPMLVRDELYRRTHR
jgi:PKD repeat protein